MLRVREQRGMSLVGVLMGLTIGTIILYILSSQLVSLAHTQKVFERESDLVSMRNYVEKSLDCGASVTPRPQACSNGRLVKLLKHDGSTLISDQADQLTVIGRYALKARCVACQECAGGKKLLVVVLLPENPRTSKSGTWQDLYRNIPIGCAIP